MKGNLLASCGHIEFDIVVKSDVTNSKNSIDISDTQFRNEQDEISLHAKNKVCKLNCACDGDFEISQFLSQFTAFLALIP